MPFEESIPCLVLNVTKSHFYGKVIRFQEKISLTRCGSVHMGVIVKGVTCNSLHVSCDSDDLESDENYAGWRSNFEIYRVGYKSLGKRELAYNRQKE